MIHNRAHRLVSTAEFSNAGHPDRVQAMDLECPFEEQRVLRMPIRVNGGGYQWPDELQWLLPMFLVAKARQDELGIDHPFCYATVRHGLANTNTDSEWHVDGFSMRISHTPEQNYVWTDHTGTEYADLSVDFPEDFNPLIHNVNHFLAQFVRPENIHQCESKVLFCMDPYILHRRPLITQSKPRTFIRISFVPIEINDIRNAVNPLNGVKGTVDGVAFRNTLVSY